MGLINEENVMRKLCLLSAAAAVAASAAIADANAAQQKRKNIRTAQADSPTVQQQLPRRRGCGWLPGYVNAQAFWRQQARGCY